VVDVWDEFDDPAPLGELVTFLLSASAVAT
jgi:hypothetical protein